VLQDGEKLPFITHCDKVDGQIVFRPFDLRLSIRAQKLDPTMVSLGFRYNVSQWFVVWNVECM
jgi:hypothetical protein